MIVICFLIIYYTRHVADSSVTKETINDPGVICSRYSDRVHLLISRCVISLITFSFFASLFFLTR